VALLAIQSRVNSTQWELGLPVIRNLFASIEKGPGSVTLGTVAPKFTLMGILVTGRTVCVHRLELEGLVAEYAVGLRVRPLQGKSVRAVIEVLGDPHLLPVVGAMAELAGFPEFPVRVFDLVVADRVRDGHRRDGNRTPENESAGCKPWTTRSGMRGP
jgi:hypothetical protein